MAASTAQDSRDDGTDDPLAASHADRDHAGQEDAQVSVPGPTAISRRFPPVNPAGAPQVAGVAAAFGAAVAIRRRNEAKGPSLLAAGQTQIMHYEVGSWRHSLKNVADRLAHCADTLSDFVVKLS